MPGSRDADNNKTAGYAPYAQLVKMLLPSAGSVAIYDPEAELLWCSDGYERPDLRQLLEQQRANETLASRGRVESTSAGVPVFISALRAPDARPLGSVVIELGNGSSRSTPSMVVSMLRPVLDCLESRLDLENATVTTDRSAGLELLLTADDNDRQDASSVADLLRNCVQQLGCVTGALLVPDKNLEFLCTPDEPAARSQLLDRTQKHLLAWAQLNNRPMVVNRGAGGGEAQYKILSCPIRDPRGRVIGLAALFRAAGAEDFEQRDIRILEFVSRKTVAILDSEHDALTGLTNRFVFERRAQRVLEREGAPSAALLYVDIDKIAAINEAFGFGAGDEVIQRVGDLVRRAAGPGALVGRVAGDCFAAVLPDRTVIEAEEVGNTIATAASQIGYVHGAAALPVSVSIGVAAARSGEPIAHLLATGELACRRAKREGRRLVLADAAAGAPAPSGQLLAASLQDALRSNGFQLEAQPLVALRDRTPQPVGYELLIRLRGADGELLAPDRFLTACEQYGLLPALDRWTLCSAAEALRGSPLARADSGLFFTVNVSAQSLESRKYGAFALETLAAAGLPASAFCFELKEGAAVANLAAAEALIRDLTKAGAKVALDDFGSGISSLAHLKRLPVDYLKIDGRFVRRMAADRVAESIVAAIASAASTLGVIAVAEHVESQAVADRLRDLGVALGQGYHFGRPAPFVAMLDQAAVVAPARLTTHA